MLLGQDRLAALADDAPDSAPRQLEQTTQLGLGHVVARAHPDAEVLVY